MLRARAGDQRTEPAVVSEAGEHRVDRQELIINEAAGDRVLQPVQRLIVRTGDRVTARDLPGVLPVHPSGFDEVGCHCGERALAVTGATRSAQFPALPTVAEAGVAGYNVTSWYGIFAPAGTPRDIIAKLHSHMAAVLQSPDVKTKLTALGAEVAISSPEEFGQIVRGEIGRWSKVVQMSGATPE